MKRIITVATIVLVIVSFSLSACRDSDTKKESYPGEPITNGVDKP